MTKERVIAVGWILVCFNPQGSHPLILARLSPLVYLGQAVDHIDQNNTSIQTHTYPAVSIQSWQEFYNPLHLTALLVYQLAHTQSEQYKFFYTRTENIFGKLWPYSTFRNQIWNFQWKVMNEKETRQMLGSIGCSHFERKIPTISNGRDDRYVWHAGALLTLPLLAWFFDRLAMPCFFDRLGTRGSCCPATSTLSANKPFLSGVAQTDTFVCTNRHICLHKPAYLSARSGGAFRPAGKSFQHHVCPVWHPACLLTLLYSLRAFPDWKHRIRLMLCIFWQLLGMHCYDASCLFKAFPYWHHSQEKPSHIPGFGRYKFARKWL